MSDPTTAAIASARRSTGHASLAVLGVKLRELDLFRPIRERVRIAQKTVRHTPADKLYDAFIALLAGAHGLVQINRLLRADPALQAAFGRPACAEQSVVQDTLDACTAANVAELHGAMVNHFVPSLAQLLDEVGLQLEAGVVRADVHAHGAKSGRPPT